MRRRRPLDTTETTDTKTEVADLLGTGFGGYDEPPTVDTLAAAEVILERLVALGWRPTSGTSADA